MIQQQLLQIILWLGFIGCLPTFARFLYAASALMWRKVFPVKSVEIRLYGLEDQLGKIVIVRLGKKDGRKIVDLIEDATAKELSKK